ncbi:hypothetical protein ACH42_01620 [Endozoicomonas sp. (ex Bugula neritina AB1)]|nr:hypothetical protein ACH42_01620 [Endozoicomonas sp. (ex Bugula neritina AB1)]
MKPIELTAPRLILRQWLPSDIEPFADMCADKRVMQYYPDTLNRAQSKALIEHFSHLINKNGWGLWALQSRQNSEFIGFTGLNAVSNSLPFAPNVEVGWRIAADYWRQGYAFEAASTVIDYGFSQLHLKGIVAFTSIENTPSLKLMEKLGMQFDQTFEHPALPQDHKLKQHCLYRLKCHEE